MGRFIITDSTAYLDPDYIASKQIRVVPLSVVLEDRSFKEGEGLTNREYFDLLRSKPIYPKTSQPSAGDFVACFEALQPGDEAVVLLISSGISGTVQSAMLARDMLDDRGQHVYVIDTQLTAGALMMIIHYAQGLLETEMPTEEIVLEMQKICQHTRIFFVVDNLEYLVRGGRLGNLARVFANIMQIKPVLQLKGGHIELYQKIRTRRQAIEHLLDLVRADQASIQRLSLMHVDCPEDARELAARVSAFYTGEIAICDIGPVIGSHVGPGTLGITWF